MPNNTIEANLRLTDQGQTVEAGINNMKRLNAEADKLESNNRRRSAAAAKAENSDYNAARALGGGTGAAGRDFGKEARSIGGLVAVYAQYAATLFAVEAAFRKLTEAVNVDNMVGGMNQLASKSGVALGALSKQFVAATGNAISLKEGIDAVQKASSAGLNNTQILNIAEGAQKAATALGRDLNDSISRLTRGVSKLEPELLDELGLYTKLGPATEKYAAAIGKPVSALTELQRTQAYSIAVLKELNEKFGDIKVDVNPYEKLAASLANLIQSGLTLVNTVLKPLVNFLSENPVALTAALAVLAKTVFDKFLPAFGEIRKNSREEADRLAAVASVKAKIANDAFKQAGLLRADEIKANADHLAEVRTQKIAEEDAKSKISREGWSKRAKEITDPTKDIKSLSDEDFKYLENRKGKTREIADQHERWARAARSLLDVYKQEEVALDNLNKKAPGRLSPARMLDDEAKQAAQRASAKGIVATAAEKAQTEGFFKAFNNSLDKIKEEKLGAIRGTFTGIAAGAAAATSRLSQFGSIIGGVLTAVGLAIGVYQLLGFALSTATLETEKLKKGIENAKETASTATSVFKRYGDALTVESLMAKTKAINNIADSFTDLAIAQEQAASKMSGWERLWDGLLPMWMGGNAVGRLSEVLADGFTKALDLAVNNSMKQKYEDSVREMLDISGPLTEKGIAAALESQGPEVRRAFIELQKTMAQETEKFTAPVQKVKENWRSLETSWQGLRNSFVNSDVGTKFTLDLIGQLDDLAAAFKEPENKLATLRDIAKDTSKIALFPEDTQANLRDMAREMSALEKQLKDATAARDAAQTKFNNAKKGVYENDNTDAMGNVYGASESIQSKVEFKLAAESELEKAVGILSGINKEMMRLSDSLKINLSSGMEAAIKFLEGPLVRAIAEANINTAKTLVSILPRSRGTIDLQLKLELESIDIRKSEIVALKALADSVTLKRLQEEKKDIDTKLETETIPEARDALRARRSKIENQEGIIAGKESYRSLNAKGELDVESAKMLAEQTGYRKALAGLEGSAEIARVNAAAQQALMASEEAKRLTQKTLDKITAEAELKYKSPEFLAKSKPEQMEIMRQDANAQQGERNVLSNLSLVGTRSQEEAVLEYANKNLLKKGMADIAIEAQKAIDKTTEDLEAVKAVQRIQKLSYNTEQDRLITAEEYVRVVQKAEPINQKLYQDRVASLDKELAINEINLERINIAERLGSINKTTQATQSYAIEIDNIRLTREKSRAETLERYRTDYDNLVISQKQAGTEATERAAEEKTLLFQNKENALKSLDEQAAKSKTLADLKKYSADQEANRLEAYNGVFLQGIDAMTDKFMQFVKTGKTSFKGLVDDMIYGLIRYQIQQQLLGIYNGPGSSFGGAAGITGAAASAAGPAQPGIFDAIRSGARSAGSWLSSLFTSAEGSAWDQGVMKYAMGGVVTEPTLFKFAHGTGMMGEAGPEAIMPLRRDSTGNLGVINGGGGKVDVVVNNFSNQQATTKETTDSRGNRKIEVIVGDMVADQISKTGSSAQQAMTANYGNRPTLVRR